MGYMCHHAIVVTTYSQENATKAHDKATEIFPVVSPLLRAAVNDYWTFLVPPDGSKEGWDESDEGDDRRARFRLWLDSQRFSDRSSPYAWVEVQYGDDEWETKVVTDSDAVLREHGILDA